MKHVPGDAFRGTAAGPRPDVHRPGRGGGRQPRDAAHHQRGDHVPRLARQRAVDADHRAAQRRRRHARPRPARSRPAPAGHDSRHAGGRRRRQRAHRAAAAVRVAAGRQGGPRRRARADGADDGRGPRPSPRGAQRGHDRPDLGGLDHRGRRRLPAGRAARRVRRSTGRLRPRPARHRHRLPDRVALHARSPRRPLRPRGRGRRGRPGRWTAPRPVPGRRDGICGADTSPWR